MLVLLRVMERPISVVPHRWPFINLVFRPAATTQCANAGFGKAAIAVVYHIFLQIYLNNE